MGFLTPALLVGALFVAVPIALHLIMRRQPQRLVFPALQFIRQRQQANRRRLNLRHWLLLALRCAIIAGLAFALARPTFQGSGLRGKQGAPLAVGLVIDNSLRMQFVQQNKTRQQAAVEMATSLIGKLPDGAQVAVTELGRSSAGFVVDLSTAEARLQSLATATNARPLVDAVTETIQLVAEREDHRQEVFVFSDLSLAAWEQSSLESLGSLLTDSPDLRIYLVDVGADEVQNLALLPLDLRRTTLRLGESLHLNASVSTVGRAEPPLLELYLLDENGNAEKRAQRVVELTPAGTGEATFDIAGLSLGTHQGHVKIPASDPLEVDNTRYFTVQVQPPANVLLLAERKQETLFLREALQPSLANGTGGTRFECSFQPFSKANQSDLSEFDAICLLDPPDLNDELWQALAQYADDGGGVGIFLGHRARANTFNSSAAMQLLPGELRLRSRYATYLRPRSLDHPALAGLRDYAEVIPWQVYPVWQFWEFDELMGNTFIVAHFANFRPALLERTVGRGRVMTLATPVSDPLQPQGREPWNLLPTGPEPWPFLALSDQLVGYLAQQGSDQLSFLAGETVNLQLSPKQQVSSYALYLPNGESVRRTLPPGEDTVLISTTRDLGNYRVASGGQKRTLNHGFSVNAPAEVSELERIEPELLVAQLPKKQVELASDLSEVERYVDIGRSGRELFPWAICLVALVWGAEHVLANRFYREAA